MISTVTPPPNSPEPGVPEVDDDTPSPADVTAPKAATRRPLAGIAVALIVLLVALAVTGITGLDGPGPLERYKYADLRQLADLVNDNAGEIRTPDDCWRTLTGAEGPLREIAKVDYLRSRVVVRLYSRQLGQIDRSVRNLSNRSLDNLLADHPELSRSMIVTEASPDGWSPNLTCRVTRGGRIAGF